WRSRCLSIFPISLIPKTLVDNRCFPVCSINGRQNLPKLTRKAQLLVILAVVRSAALSCLQTPLPSTTAVRDRNRSLRSAHSQRSDRTDSTPEVGRRDRTLPSGKAGTSPDRSTNSASPLPGTTDPPPWR